MPYVITTVAIIAAVAGTVATATAAKKQSNAIKDQADQEELAAKGLEAKRRQQLNRLLASNVVGLQDSGLTGQGTPQSISLENARVASLSEGLESLKTSLKTAQLRRQARSSRTVGNIGALSTALSASVQIEKNKKNKKTSDN